jgi:hypothetical protein
MCEQPFLFLLTPDKPSSNRKAKYLIYGYAFFMRHVEKRKNHLLYHCTIGSEQASLAWARAVFMVSGI